MGKTDSASAESDDKEKEVTKPNKSSSSVKQEEPKENVENLRKVIKLNDNAKNSDDKESNQSPEAKKDEENEELDGIDDLVEEAEEEGTIAPASTREELEQKRAILQRIKDFDFQIKKNQQDINAVGEKITALSKDLDDLVSLYEIVSEQMNPFVGLSKVTKKRLESLENITKEVDTLKDKLSTIEANNSIQSLQHEQPPTVEPSYELDLSDHDMDRIIEMSFSEIIPDSQVGNSIDDAIDVFIENLKAGKIN